MMAKLRITLTRSLIGSNEKQKATVRALGLGKVNSSVLKEDTQAIRGMAARVGHLLTVEECED